MAYDFHTKMGNRFYFGLQYKKSWVSKNIETMPKVMPIEWKLSGTGKCSSEEKYYSYFFFGTYNIRITGKCNKEDLEKIEKLR